MDDKQIEKQIKNIAADLQDCQEFSDVSGYQTDFYNTAVNLWDKGYRKTEVVTKLLDERGYEVEVLKKERQDIFQEIYGSIASRQNTDHISNLDLFIDEVLLSIRTIAHKHGVEIEE